ncbi:MAG: S41 family peptidase [Gemmatimonadaceae bacterium]
MKPSLLALVLLIAPAGVLSGGRAVFSQEPPAFLLRPASASMYAMTSNGRVTDAGGASVTIHSTTAMSGGSGIVDAVIPLQAMRGKRLRLVGEIRTENAQTGASLWVRIDSGSTMLLLENGMTNLVRGSSDWVTRSVTLPVLEEATSASLGLLLFGSGVAEARNMRIEFVDVKLDAPMDPLAKAVLDSAIILVKTIALKRKDVQWNVVEPRVRQIAAGAQKSSDVYVAISYMIKQLNDHHSAHLKPVQATQFRNGGAENPLPVVKTMPGNLGYISVPAYGGIEPAAARNYAMNVHTKMEEIRAQTSCGWVVDLRANGGGNMWPMLAGLKPFFGNDSLGTFVVDDKVGQPWVAGASVNMEPPSSLAGMHSAAVAVLVGARTASSGEAVTIAFRGRPLTRIFGEPTAGLTSANAQFPLPDGSIMNLAVSVEADRTGRRYGYKIDPDELIKSSAPGSATDSTLDRAVSWLAPNGNCAKAGR